MSLNTTAATWVTGTVVTAAQLNLEVRDAINGMQAAWTAYTPAWTGSTTNPVIGNGTLVGRSGRIGKTIVGCKAVVLGGTTTTVGSGVYSLSLPFASIAGTEQPVSADFFDGAAHYAAVGLIASGASVVNPFSAKGGTSGSVIGVGSTSFSAGALAIIACEGTYEAA